MQGEGRSSLFTGSNDRACEGESREDPGKRKGSNHSDSRRDEQRGQGGANKEATVGQDILSGILPVFGNRIYGYRNLNRMAINGMMKRLCKEEDVGYVDLWDSFVGKEDMYVRDGLHLSGTGAAVFAEGLSGAVTSGLGKVRYLN